MVGFVSARFVVSRLVALWRVNNHSRDRHGSTFDGAEWDASRLVWVWQIVLWFVMSRRCWFGYAYKPHSCRHGSRSTREVWDVPRRGRLCCVEKSRGLFGLGEFCHGYQPPRGRRGFGFDAGWWLVFRRISVCVVSFGQSLTTTKTAVCLQHEESVLRMDSITNGSRRRVQAAVFCEASREHCRG